MQREFNWAEKDDNDAKDDNNENDEHDDANDDSDDATQRLSLAKYVEVSKFERVRGELDEIRPKYQGSDE